MKVDGAGPDPVPLAAPPAAVVWVPLVNGADGATCRVDAGGAGTTVAAGVVVMTVVPAGAGVVVFDVVDEVLEPELLEEARMSLV